MPFVDWIDNAQAIAEEAGVMLVSVLVSAFTFDLSERVKTAFDVAGVWTVRGILIISILLALAKLVMQLAKTLCKYKQTMESLRSASIHS